MNQSMVSFCALQLELDDEPSNLIPDIDFNCNRTIEDLFRDLEISNPVAKIKPNKQDPENYRGTRQMSKIVIETYIHFKGGMSETQKGEKQKPSSNSSKVSYKIGHSVSVSVPHNITRIWAFSRGFTVIPKTIITITILGNIPFVSQQSGSRSQ